MSNEKKKQTLAIYGCGGGGINVVQDVVQIPRAAGFPDTTVYRIDTSNSNIKTMEDMPEPYLIAGIKGAGKHRAFAHSVVVGQIDDILLTNPPMDFNIVVFSLSGGSGNILGLLIITELLKRKIPVVAICIGSTASGIEANNTLKSIASLQSISSSVVKRPVVCNIHMNSKDTPRSVVDERIDNNIRALCLLVSGCNEELDDKDLRHWLDYDAVTDVSPQLVDLVIHIEGGDKTLTTDDLHGISVASLLPGKEFEPIALLQPYQCTGILPTGVLLAGDAELHPMHFIITNDLLRDRVEQLNVIVQSFDENAKRLAAVEQMTVVSDTTDGIVL